MSKNVLDIRPARREGARAVFGFAGVSGSGKTFSAIQFAYGLAGYNAAKVGLLDTENRRGSLYAEILEHATTRPTSERFLIGDLVAPFSPSRYRDAVLQFQDAGVDVLVIDSATHEWEGVGGCDDIANAPDSKGNQPKVPRWNAAKREHRAFMNALLQCDMHVVACIRARDKVKMIPAHESKTGKIEFEHLGILPVQEKNFMFEMTASLLMHDAGTRYERTKVPAALANVFPGDKYITADTGAAVRAWINAGGKVDPVVEKWRNRLLSIADQGVGHIETCWAKVPPAVQAALGSAFYSQLAASAEEFDAQKKLGEEPEAVTAINAQAQLMPAAPVHLDF